MGFAQFPSLFAFRLVRQAANGNAATAPAGVLRDTVDLRVFEVCKWRDSQPVSHQDDACYPT
jgi:hypothetical protein